MANRPSFGTRRRGELFDSLLALFLAEGFAHLTLDDIAARLRCSKGTLYTLAGSKEQLVHAVAVHFFRRATDDRFFVVIDATDPAFDDERTAELLAQTRPLSLEYVID